jgi:hypothetical protein
VNGILHGAARMIATAGVVVAAVGTLRTRRAEPGLRMALDLWTAAGLLDLTASESGAHIAAVATIVLLRRVLATGIFRRRRGAPPRGDAPVRAGYGG